MKTFRIVLWLAVMMLCGCSAHKTDPWHHKPTRAPQGQLFLIDKDWQCAPKLGTYQNTGAAELIEVSCFRVIHPAEQCKDSFWNPEEGMCQNVPYCPKSGCAPIPASNLPVAPPMPKDRDCGADITFENGETWVYPCFPAKAIPKCVSGCKP